MSRETDLALALDYALCVLIKFEPPDSRAISGEFVSMAAISCDCANEECREILRTAIARDAEGIASEGGPLGERA